MTNVAYPFEIVVAPGCHGKPTAPVVSREPRESSGSTRRWRVTLEVDGRTITVNTRSRRGGSEEPEGQDSAAAIRSDEELAAVLAALAQSHEVTE